MWKLYQIRFVLLFLPFWLKKIMIHLSGNFFYFFILLNLTSTRSTLPAVWRNWLDSAPPLTSVTVWQGQFMVDWDHSTYSNSVSLKGRHFLPFLLTLLCLLWMNASTNTSECVFVHKLLSPATNAAAAIWAQSALGLLRRSAQGYLAFADMHR